jgi:DNA gyrase subunit A
MGRNAAGVRGIRMPEGERVISLIVPDPNGLILVASENGYGKLTSAEEFPVHGRGGQGVIAIQTTERNGQLVAATQVTTENELMLMSSGGTIVRTPASEVSVLGRNTQGVRLMRLDEGERLVGVESVDPEPPSTGEEGVEDEADGVDAAGSDEASLLTGADSAPDAPTLAD